MMRATHVASGIAAALWLSPLAPIAGSPIGLAAWTAATAGYAQSPDMDHPASVIARMWGPLSRPVARSVRAICGHRGMTHRVWVIAAAGAAVWAGVSGWWVTAATAVARFVLRLTGATGDPVAIAYTSGSVLHLFTIAFAAGAALAAARITGAVNFAASWIAAGAAHMTGAPVGWLPWAAALGVACHIAGDSLTKGGVPFRGGRAGARLIITGGKAEKVILWLLAAAIIAWPFRHAVMN